MTPETLSQSICREFCGGLSVSVVPAGFAVSTDIHLDHGDPLTFYISEASEGWLCEDDGDFMASAIASGTFTDKGSRRESLDAILADHGAHLDRDTYQIIREPNTGNESASKAALAFLSGLIRVRDIILLSRERVAASFADDVREALENTLGERFDLSEDDDADNPADFLLKDIRTGLRAALIYAVNSDAKLMTALLRHAEQEENEAPVIAVMQGMGNGQVSNRKFMMAQNRSLLMPFFAANDNGAMKFIESHVLQA